MNDSIPLECTSYILSYLDKIEDIKNCLIVNKTLSMVVIDIITSISGNLIAPQFINKFKRLQLIRGSIKISSYEDFNIINKIKNPILIVPSLSYIYNFFSQHETQSFTDKYYKLKVKSTSCINKIIIDSNKIRVYPKFFLLDINIISLIELYVNIQLNNNATINSIYIDHSLYSYAALSRLITIARDNPNIVFEANYLIDSYLLFATNIKIHSHTIISLKRHKGSFPSVKLLDAPLILDELELILKSFPNLQSFGLYLDIDQINSFRELLFTLPTTILSIIVYTKDFLPELTFKIPIIKRSLPYKFKS